MPEGEKSITKGKGKQPKKFVEQKDTALQLASIIVDKQEGTAKDKIERRNRHAQAPTRTSKPRPTSKEKLKEVKASIKAERARAKKDKIKARKRQTNQSVESSGGGQSLQADPSKKRRRVAFA